LYDAQYTIIIITVLQGFSYTVRVGAGALPKINTCNILMQTSLPTRE